MKKLLFKSSLYFILILFVLEIIVRVFHLYNERPIRYIDEFGVQKWIPNQEGYAVTGNRRQNFVKYNINESGFNSYREFVPRYDKIELAILGDSFIEGFHQDYFNSIGSKIERRLVDEDIRVFEYGHSSNDLADQLNYITTYKESFDKIDYIIIGLKYENDLTRDSYELIKRKPVLPVLNKSKLFLYAKNIGVIDPVKNKVTNVISSLKSSRNTLKEKGENKGNDAVEEANKNKLYLSNFKKLLKTHKFDKTKMFILLDSRVTDETFMNYLNSSKIEYIDFSTKFAQSKRPTTLIYDRHWNNNGRTIIANLITDFIENKLEEKRGY
jgi:hypothetical protein